MYIDSKYKRCVTNSSHSCHPHISYILTPGFLLHLDCALIVSGKQKILLFFAYCSQTTRLKGHWWAEVFWNIYLFFLKWNIFFWEKMCVVLLYFLEIFGLLHSYRALGFIYMKYVFRIYWLPAKAIWGIAHWFSSDCRWSRNPRGTCENKEKPHIPTLYLDRILRQYSGMVAKER